MGGEPLLIRKIRTVILGSGKFSSIFAREVGATPNFELVGWLGAYPTSPYISDVQYRLFDHARFMALSPDVVICADHPERQADYLSQLQGYPCEWIFEKPFASEMENLSGVAKRSLVHLPFFF